MSYMDTYKDWLSWCDEEAKAELLAIEDSKELEDRFYTELKFGTGGMRGVMGMGPNRMNKYMIRKATKDDLRRVGNHAAYLLQPRSFYDLTFFHGDAGAAAGLSAAGLPHVRRLCRRCKDCFLQP